MRSRLSFVLLFGLLAGLVSACGGKPEALTQKALFAKVAAAQDEKGSFHVTGLQTLGGQTAHSYGDVKLGKNAAHNAMAMTISGAPGGGKVEVRLVSQKLYFGLGELTKNKFVKFDLTDKSNPVFQQAGEAVANMDPAHQLGQYKGGIEKFDSSGKLVKIDDVETRPYKMTIDPSKTRRSKGLDGSKLPKTIVLTLYVDADDLPRRAIVRVPAARGAGSTRQQTDYSKWGEKVSIAAPTSLIALEDTPLSQLGQLSGQ